MCLEILVSATSRPALAVTDPCRVSVLPGGKGPWLWPFSLIWLLFSFSTISHHPIAHLLVPSHAEVPKDHSWQRCLPLIVLCLELSVPRSARGCLPPVMRSQLEYHLGTLSWTARLQESLLLVTIPFPILIHFLMPSCYFHLRVVCLSPTRM